MVKSHFLGLDDFLSSAVLMSVGLSFAGVLQAGDIFFEDFEDGILDSRVTIETVGTFNSYPSIKDITEFGSTKGFGYGMSTCWANCFDGYVTDFRITLTAPTFIDRITFKEMELYGNWGSKGKIYVDGLQLTNQNEDFGRQPTNDHRADTTYRVQDYSIGQVATTIELKVADITNASEICIDDVEISAIIEKDATIAEILSPGGAVSLYTTLTPVAVVQNQGIYPETFPVHFQIGTDYSDTVSTSLAPNQTDTLVFSDWTAGILGAVAVRCSTALPDDENTENDSKTGTVNVTPPTDGVANYWAIIVGISSFQSLDYDQLLPLVEFSNKDAQDLYDALLGYPNWRSRRPVLLKDYQATKSAMELAFSGIEADEDDVFLFYFSGLGFSVPDSYPYEATDGSEGYLMPYDSSPSSNDFDIREDELASWLARVRASKKCLILDAGFASISEKGGTGSEGFEEIYGPNRVILFAYRDDESTLLPIRSFSNHAFTHFLTEGLNQHPSGNEESNITAEGLFAYASRMIEEMPAIQIVGAATQHPRLFDGYEGDFTMVISSSLATNLGGAHCFPNPFKPFEGHTKVTFTKLTDHTRLHIYDITGAPIYEVEAFTPDGTLSWDGRNASGRQIASGIYIYVITNDRGETRTGKLAVIK